MFGDVVLGVEHEDFEHILSSKKKKRKIKLDTELNTKDLKEIVAECERLKTLDVARQAQQPQGAFEVDPDLSIGIDLHVPEWGGGAYGRIYRREGLDTKRDRESPVGFYLMAETLEDRMMFMEILSQVFIGFPVFGFGTDFERARMGQILYYVKTLKGEIPESIFVGPRGFREFGVRPRVVLIGPYNYCRTLVDHIACSDATRAWVGDDDHGIFVFRESIESAKRFILHERHRWRKAISSAGGVPGN